MSVFTTVTAAQLDLWLKNYDLGTRLEFKGIAAGIENTNYFVTTTEGRYVLTLFEKLTAQDLPYYLNLMAHLAQHGAPCAAPIANHSGLYLGELNGKPASLVTRLNGKDLLTPTPADCAKVGAALARIHVAGQTYKAHMDNPRGPAWWKATAPLVLPFMDAADAALLSAEVAKPDTLGNHALPRGPIHADVFRDNVLFDQGEVAGIIDFYFACTGPLIYDVAITVNDWCLQADSHLASAHTAALLAGYHAVRPFTSTEREAWPGMLRLGALRFWVSRLFDLHLPRAGELTHAKDPGHFARLLQTHIARAHTPLALPV